jgi:SnoaL-like domain
MRKEEQNMADIDLAALARDVRFLKDRLEILDVVNRHSRGHDRFDLALMSDCYHADGIDEHGSFAVHSGPEYGEWANQTHAAGSQMCLHNITTHTCAESYVIGTMLNQDGATCRFLNGRYIDRLERREGTWRIALRRCTVDVVLKGDSSIMQTDLFRHYGMIKGSRDGADLSYDRPLTMERPVDRW